MHTTEAALDPAVPHPVTIDVRAQTEDRNRLTTAFRFFLAIPHLVLVGAPVAMVTSLDWGTERGWNFEYGSGGLLGAVACFGAVISWFAILFTGRQPEDLWKLSSFYLRWRVRAVAYLTLLRDEYPPFGEGEYGAQLIVEMPRGERDRVSVALRLFLAIPHLIVVWLLSIAWAFTTALAWVAILLTGRYPETLYGFAIGVLAWTMRVEAYMLLMRDEYPPFTLRA